MDFPYGEALAHVHIVRITSTPEFKTLCFSAVPLPEILIPTLKAFPPCAIENSGHRSGNKI